MKRFSRCAPALFLAIVVLICSTSLFSAAQTLTLTCAGGTAEVGVAYSSSLTVSGGVAPYTFSITSGALPPGLTLDPASGAITGTPTQAGKFNYHPTVVDSQGNTATSKCQMVVSGHVEIDCPNNGKNVGEVGVPFSVQVPAIKGVPPYTFALISGSLPPGLSLNPNTGVISGIPTQAGTFLFTLQVTDSLGATFNLRCQIKIKPALTLICASSTGQVGVAYSSALIATGGVSPYTFSIIAGSLPPGLTLNPSTGAITGTPTQPGAFNFTAQVVDSDKSGGTGVVTTNCSITISPAPITLACAGGTAQVGVPYSSALVATGGVPPYTFSIITGSLPPGLTLNTSTGAITGTPTQAGTFNFTAQVVDSTGSKAGTATANCSIVVAPPAITLACAGGTAQVGVAYSSALVATGWVPPYTFSIISGSLPPGLTLNTSTGAITGTPTQAGTFNFTAQVVDSTGTQAGTATANCQIVVSPPAITLTCPSGAAQIGMAYNSALVVSGGTPPYTFSITSGSLPPGLTLNTSTGAITGTPTQAGTFNFTAQVVDSTGTQAGTATANCSIVVSSGVCVAGAINQSIKANASFAAVGLDNTNFTISSGNTWINGNMGVGVDGLFNMSGGATDNGTLYADPTAQITITGGSAITGGTVTQSMAGVQTAAVSVSNQAATLTPTQTSTDITSSTTITGNGGQNVISITGSFNLQGGSTLTIQGSTSDTFIFNVSNGVTLGGGSNIVLSGGVSPSQVLFNFPPGSSGQVNTNGNSQTSGTFLAPYLPITVSGGVHVSEFVTGGQLTLQSGPNVTAPDCSGDAIGQSCTLGYYKNHSQLIQGCFGIASSTLISTLLGPTSGVDSCVGGLTLLQDLQAPGSKCGGGTLAQAELIMTKQLITAVANGGNTNPAACDAAAVLIGQADQLIAGGNANAITAYGSYLESTYNNDKIGNLCGNGNGPQAKSRSGQLPSRIE
ncbi:MAG: putative Ig domain-containing protein [Terriglobales bacterium]